MEANIEIGGLCKERCEEERRETGRSRQETEEGEEEKQKRR